jgi:nucleolar protein 4
MSAETPQAKQDDTLDRKTLFVRSIPFDVTNDKLTDFFSQFAPVKHAVIVNDSENKSRGFGFVSFTSDDDTLLALQEAKKSKLNDRLLRVDIAKRRERKGDKSATPKTNKPTSKPEEVAIKKTARLIIRNLPWSVKNTDELIKIFKAFGPVKEAKIPKKPDGKMCGFAFVTMAKHANAEKAVKHVGMKINGRDVAVDFAVNKTHWDTLKTTQQDTQDMDVDEETSDKEDESEAKKEEQSNASDVEEEEEDADAADADGDAEDAKLLELDDSGEGENRQKRNRQERYSVFVRNLPYDVTEDSLKAHFEKLGPVKYALPVVDKETGLPRGTAFVAFTQNTPYEECLLNAPAVSPNSVLLPDDVSPFYVYEGRIMQIAPALDRESAARMAERSANNRKELLGRVPKEQDKRNLYLLNEGRIGPNSKLANLLTQGDMDVRERSFNLRLEQLKKNPGLHLSMTRLAVRNLPRAMNDKSFKQLGRKAIVEFATEVKGGTRQPLSKEEIDRSTKHKHFVLEKLGITDDDEKKKVSKHGVVTQAKVINEVKGSGEYGRSRGYGFLEFRDHKHALMALRWLNAHEVTKNEITCGLTEEQKRMAEREKTINKRRLVVEFAIENASVVKRRYDQISKSRNAEPFHKRSREEDGDDEKKGDRRGDRRGDRGGDRRGDRRGDDRSDFKRQKGNGGKRGNMNKGANVGRGSKPAPTRDDKNAVSMEVKQIIGKKRRQRKQGKN